MSCYLVQYKDKAKTLRPISSKEEYLKLRGSLRQKRLVADVRNGNADAKRRLLQFNYSCVPGEDSMLKGCQQMSGSVGMDIDFPANHPDPDHLAEWLKKVPEMVMGKKDEIGLLMLERSARKGYHLVFRRRKDLSQEENLKWASRVLGVDFDEAAKDITRVFFATTDSTEDLIFLDPELFNNDIVSITPTAPKAKKAKGEGSNTSTICNDKPEELKYLGIEYSKILDKFWEVNYDGEQPTEGCRNMKIYDACLALRVLVDYDREKLRQIIPLYDGFTEEERDRCIDSALAARMGRMPESMKKVLQALKKENRQDAQLAMQLEEAMRNHDRDYLKDYTYRPMGIRESIDAVKPSIKLPALIASSAWAGGLATRVRLSIHDEAPNTLNLISICAGAAGSGKSALTPLWQAWSDDLRKQDEKEKKKLEAWELRRKAKEEEKPQKRPKFKIRCHSKQTTVAKMAENIEDCQGEHVISHFSESDLVSRGNRTQYADLSIMLRQAFDADYYGRESCSDMTRNIEIPNLRWNINLCTQPEGLHKIFSSYTDGFAQRVAIALIPDNPYEQLALGYHLKDETRDIIIEVSQLLQLMEGELTLEKLEHRSQQWLESIRLESCKDDDRVKAGFSHRTAVMGMRIITINALCAYAERLIRTFSRKGRLPKWTSGAINAKEYILIHNGDLLQKEIEKELDDKALTSFDTICDYLLDNSMICFRKQVEKAQSNELYEAITQSSERSKIGKNDTVFDKLGETFTFDEACDAKGDGYSRNTVSCMLKHWRDNRLIEEIASCTYRKMAK